MVEASRFLTGRTMMVEDVPRVAELETLSFGEPWDIDELKVTIQQMSCFGIVFEVRGQIAGYILFEVAEQEIRILTMAVHPEHRRKGFGTVVVFWLKCRLRAWKRKRLVVIVSERSLIAQIFFRYLGFKAKQTLKAWCLPNEEDAYLMEWSHGESQV